VIALVVASVSLAIWLYLLIRRGLFWRTTVQLPPPSSSISNGGLPRVVAVVPARDEADMLPRTLPTLLAQDYCGAFDVIVVDDASSDGTGDIARSLGARVIRTSGPPSGWAGKVAAMAAGFWERLIVPAFVYFFAQLRKSPMR
jgi:cellulose synthase/poly-beta-1,6-N-acetylglucosamine synthase-like glycosyltransferase